MHYLTQLLSRPKWALFGRIDWMLMGAVLCIAGAGLIAMNAFVVETNYFFDRQVVWLLIGLALCVSLSFVDFRFLRRTNSIVTLFVLQSGILLAILLFADITKGVQSWFTVGSFAFQPSDPAKLVLILLLAKYFSRRHVEIARIRHIIVPGLYTSVMAGLIFLQPDFGSAVILIAVWFGMILIAGVSKKHLALLFLIGVLGGGLLWNFTLADYQKERITSFLHPYTDLQGAGYNAYQSTVAVGSGGVWGKGIGFGTQSRLEFLPEYETDFIFAAFAEEWGLVGVSILFALFIIVFWRVVHLALQGTSNFEVLFGFGLAVLFMSHFVVHIGMNIGLLPVTGTTLPFMSYGGSHIVTEFIGLGILFGMRSNGRKFSRIRPDGHELVGPSSF